MFKGMGIEWASTLLGCVATLLVPIPIIFYLYGQKIRAKSKFAPTPVSPDAYSEPANGSAEDTSDAVALEKGTPREAQTQANVPRRNDSVV